MEVVIAAVEADRSAAEAEGEERAEAATSDIDAEVIRTATAAVLHRKEAMIERQQLHMESAQRRQHEADIAYAVSNTEPLGGWPSLPRIGCGTVWPTREFL